MIIVLILISIALIILSLFSGDEEMVSIPLVGLIIKMGVLVYLLAVLINGRAIDDEIKLIEEQNTYIAEKVELSVKQYMEYEGKTLTELKPDSYVNLVNLYPELKSDTLIQEQIKTYQENNNKITKMKMQKIKLSNYRWWIYFGR